MIRQRTLLAQESLESTELFVKKYSAAKESSSHSVEWKIEDFTIIHELGRGKFGQVFAALEPKSDYLVALKKMGKEELVSNNFVQQLTRQIVIQSSLSHRNVLKLFGYFWDEANIYLILEYAPGGELYHLLKRKRRLSEKNVSVIIRQVCEGLKYLHGRQIIHRDIKPENILLSLGTIKIADFGWSIHSQRNRETLCGTLDYLSPEMVRGETHSNAIDVWSIGVLAYELAVGRPPFEMESHEDTFKKILQNSVEFPEYVSFELRNFIRRCLKKDPAQRLNIREVEDQDFIRKYLNEELQIGKSS